MRWALKTVTEQDIDSLEILVSDNCSECDVRSVVNDAKDTRVRYIRTPARMGMTEHWNWAIEQARGEWLTVVGDDDGLTPHALKVLHQVVSGDLDLEHVGSSRAVYVWPGVLDDGAPLLTVPVTSGRVQQLDLAVLSRSALLGRTTWRGLPMIYTGGWVRMEALNRIRDRGGVLLRGMSPDVYSGAALTWTLRRAAVVDEVLAITGTSSHSNGLAQLRGDTAGPQSPGYAFSRETGFRIHPALCATPEEDVPVSDYALFLDAWLHATHLHQVSEIEWKEVVAALIDSAIPISNAVFRDRELARARRLAEKRGVHWESALRDAMSRRRIHCLSPRAAIRQWTSLASLEEIREPERDLRNVLSASQAVANLRHRGPSSFKRASRATRFAASRLIPRLSELLGSGAS